MLPRMRLHQLGLSKLFKLNPCFRFQQCNPPRPYAFSHSFPSHSLLHQGRGFASRARRPGRAAEYDTLTDRLAKKETATPLYDCKSYGQFIFGCYSVGLTLIWAGYVNSWVIAPARQQAEKKEIAEWVPIVEKIIPVLMIAGGGYLCYRVC